MPKNITAILLDNEYKIQQKTIRLVTIFIALHKWHEKKSY